MTRLTRRRLLQRGAAVAATGTLGSLLPTAPALSARRRAGDGAGVWIAGDLHVHSTYSHDVYGGPSDDNTGPEEFYTAGLPVAGKFAEARARGLGYLAITDHNDVRSVADLRGAAGGLIALPGYEHSIRGHAQMLGTSGLLDPGDEAADAVNAMAGELRAGGGVFQSNHPAYRLALDEDFDGCSSGGCDECRNLHWTYGFDVKPDTVEVWNPTVARSDASELYWECWLDRGERVAATGGSDSHWTSLHAVAGPGQPTTWVRADDATPAGVLDGLRRGRTTISGQPPGLGGPQLLLDAPREATLGDAVAPGARLRVRAPGLQVPAVLRVRANRAQILEVPFDPGDVVRFRAPREAGWVRAILLARAALPVSTAVELGDATPQRDGMPMLALTSPIYLRRPRTARRR